MSVVGQHAENFHVLIFLDAINMISVKVGMMVLLTELFLCISLSVTLIMPLFLTCVCGFKVDN